jgi:hypothetical protein
MQTVMQHPDAQHLDATAAPAGNGKGARDLSRFHTIPSEEREHNVTGKIVGTIVGLAILLGGAFYLYSVSTATPPPIVPASQLPAPAPLH